MPQVATTFAAAVKTLSTRQDSSFNVLSILKQGNSFVDAKCAALGAEIAQLHRCNTCMMKQNPEKGT